MREQHSSTKLPLKEFSAALLLLWLFTAYPAAAGTVVIAAPSDTWNGVVTLGPKRDFLVQGTLSGFEGPVNVKVTVTDGSGNVVRAVTSDVNAMGWSDNVDVSKVKTKWTEDAPWTDNIKGLQNNPSPDLVKNADAGNMAVINSLGEYSALIPGGAGGSVPVTPLAKGDYTLKVEVVDRNDASLASDSLKITVGASDMVAARFSPTAADGYPHLEKAIQFAKDNNLKALLDSFPAYWEKDKPEKVFYEDCKMWRANDLSEYLAAVNSHVIIYNISEGCASQVVEIGGLIGNNYLQDETAGHHVYFYRYNIGDVNVTYTRSDGSTATSAGKIVPFDGTSKTSGYNQLAVARAERRDPGVATEENMYDPAQTDKTIDSNASDGVYIKPAQTLSLLGAVAPLQTDEFDYTPESEKYVVKNRIAEIRYTITAPDGASRTEVRKVNLTRQYNAAWLANSIYEYKNDFPAAEYFSQEGEYVIGAEGLDSHGRLVGSASQSFRLTVSGTGLIAPKGAAFTANQLSAGGAVLNLQMDELLSASDSRWKTYASFSGTQGAASALDSLSGAVKADSMRLVMTPGDYAFKRLRRQPQGRGFWAEYFSSRGSSDSYDMKNSGVTLGYDRQFTPETGGGVFFAKASPQITGNYGRAEADDWQAGLYGRFTLKNNYSLKAWLGYGWQSYDLFRSPMGYGVKGNFKGHSATAALEFVKEIPLSARFFVEPTLGLGYKRVKQDAFCESGDEVIGLRYDEAGHDETSLYLGASLRHELRSSVLYASAFYKRRIFDSGINLKARFLPGGAPFVITGEELPKDALAISAGYRCGLSKDENHSLAVEYEGEFGAGFKKNQFNLRYEMRL